MATNAILCYEIQMYVRTVITLKAYGPIQGEGSPAPARKPHHS